MFWKTKSHTWIFQIIMLQNTRIHCCTLMIKQSWKQPLNDFFGVSIHLWFKSPFGTREKEMSVKQTCYKIASPSKCSFYRHLFRAECKWLKKVVSMTLFNVFFPFRNILSEGNFRLELWLAAVSNVSSSGTKGCRSLAVASSNWINVR